MNNLLKTLSVATGIAVITFAVSVAGAAEPLNGAALYEKTCMACHKDPAKKAGKPADQTFKKLKDFQTMACPVGKVVEKQKILKNCSDDQLKAIASYLEKLK